MAKSNDLDRLSVLLEELARTLTKISKIDPDIKVKHSCFFTKAGIVLETGKDRWEPRLFVLHPDSPKT